jgi:hypothetical protein
VLSFFFPSLARHVFIFLPFLLTKHITEQRIELNYHHLHHHYHNGYYPFVFLSVCHVVKLVCASFLLYLMHWLWILKFPSNVLGVHERKSSPSLWLVRNHLTPNIYATHVTWPLCRSAGCLSGRGTGWLWMLYCSFGTSGPQLLSSLTPPTPGFFLARTVYEILLVYVFVVWCPQSFWSRLEFVIMVIWKANNLCSTCFVKLLANKAGSIRAVLKVESPYQQAGAANTDNLESFHIAWYSALWSVFCLSTFWHTHLLLGWVFTLKMEVIRSSESLLHVQTTRRYIPQEGSLHIYCCENLILYTSSLFPWDS